MHGKHMEPLAARAQKHTVGRGACPLGGPASPKRCKIQELSEHCYDPSRSAGEDLWIGRRR